MANKKFIDLLDKVITAPDNLYPEKLMFSYQGVLYPAVISSQKILKLLNPLKSGMMCY